MAQTCRICALRLLLRVQALAARGQRGRSGAPPAAAGLADRVVGSRTVDGTARCQGAPAPTLAVISKSDVLFPLFFLGGEGGGQGMIDGSHPALKGHGPSSRSMPIGVTLIVSPTLWPMYITSSSGSKPRHPVISQANLCCCPRPRALHQRPPQHAPPHMILTTPILGGRCLLQYSVQR